MNRHGDPVHLAFPFSPFHFPVRQYSLLSIVAKVDKLVNMLTVLTYSCQTEVTCCLYISYRSFVDQGQKVA